MNGHMLLLNIVGGVALLLWATRMVRTGITRAYGAEIRSVLGYFTKHRLSSFALGVGVAGLLQSSTATVLLLVSFASRGLIAVGAGLALMLGPDVGTTLVVQVLSFDISWLSPALILIGVIAFLGSSATFAHHIGRIFIGLGNLLFRVCGVDRCAATDRPAGTRPGPPGGRRWPADRELPHPVQPGSGRSLPALHFGDGASDGAHLSRPPPAGGAGPAEVS